MPFRNALEASHKECCIHFSSKGCNFYADWDENGIILCGAVASSVFEILNHSDMQTTEHTGKSDSQADRKRRFQVNLQNSHLHLNPAAKRMLV